MELDQKTQLITFFTDPLLLSYITDYLPIKERLAISALSKKLRFIMQNHFNSLLKENKLHLIPGKSSIHQMHFYFDRCLRIFRHQKEVQAKEQFKEAWQKKEKENKKKKQIVHEEQSSKFKQILVNTIQRPFKFTVITDFQVGPRFTICLDNKEKAFVFKTNQVIASAENKEKAKYRQYSQVRDASAKAEKLIIIKSNGEVMLQETEKASLELDVIRQTLPWSFNIPIKSVEGSFTYALFELENPQTSKQYLAKHLFNYNIELNQVQQPKQEQVPFETYLITLNMLSNALFIVKVPATKVVSIAVGHKQAFLVNEKHQCFIVEFEHLNQGQIELIAKPFPYFIGKNIMSVFSGYNFFVAFERNIQNMDQWTTDRVAQWLRQIGFGAFVKIARAEKIDGKKLKNMERKYMENVLGLTKLNMQQKLLLCIEEVIQGKNQYDQLWVWGKNEFGQLGSSNANYITNPQKVKMDFLQQKDSIDRVFCGWFQTFIRTHRGKIYCSVMRSEKKKKKQIEQKQIEEQMFSDQEDFRKEGEEINRFKNKKRKFTQDYKEESKKVKGHRKKFQEEQHWRELQSGKAFFVQAYKDHTFIIQCPDQNKFQPIKQKKLRTAKAVIDKILWAGPYDKSEFKIGIIDKDMGTIQVSLTQIQAFDYKQNSIRYVKRGNLIVWDRQSKIDHI